MLKPTLMRRTLKQVEHDYILEVLNACEGNVQKAARILDVSPKTIFNRTSRIERWNATDLPKLQVPPQLEKLWASCETESDKIWVTIQYYRGDRKKAANVLQMSRSLLTRKQFRPRPKAEAPPLQFEELPVGFKSVSGHGAKHA